MRAIFHQMTQIWVSVKKSGFKLQFVRFIGETNFRVGKNFSIQIFCFCHDFCFVVTFFCQIVRKLSNRIFSNNQFWNALVTFCYTIDVCYRCMRFLWRWSSQVNWLFNGELMTWKHDLLQWLRLDIVPEFPSFGMTSAQKIDLAWQHQQFPTFQVHTLLTQCSST